MPAHRGGTARSPRRRGLTVVRSRSNSGMRLNHARIPGTDFHQHLHHRGQRHGDVARYYAGASGAPGRARGRRPIPPAGRLGG